MKQYLLPFLLLFYTSCRPVASSPEENVQQDSTALAQITDTLPAPQVKSSLYYWKTIFQLSEADKQFIHDHQIGRIYVRFFDVDNNSDRLEDKAPSPIATVIFKERPLANLEIVPTVFITNEAMKEMAKTDTIPQIYAQKIAKRVFTMVQTNDIPNVHEIQIDCDWTQTSQSAFFTLLKELRKIAHEHQIRLSATIRLHQLTLPVPPVDRGVLMCYNTGNFSDRNTTNSIIDYQDILPYGPFLKDYLLPIDIAYPTYSWGLWFKDKQFKGILKEVDYENRTLYKPVDKNLFRVQTNHYKGSSFLEASDIIRYEISPVAEINKVKKLLEPEISNKNYSVILYHLDMNNLLKYSHDEIKSFYNR